MEPLKGGRLTDKIPAPVKEIWDDAKANCAIEEDRTPAKTAFKWVAAQEGVKLILSGMGTKQQLDENIAVFSDENLKVLGEDELAAIDAASAEYNKLIRYQCTGCEYCMPCEKKINIPDVIDYLNNWYAFGQNPSTKIEYTTWIPEGHHGSDCIGCGQCEAKCPQSLPIMDIMKDAAREFGV